MNWRSFPIFVIENDGEKFVLPTSRDLKILNEQLVEFQEAHKKAVEEKRDVKTMEQLVKAAENRIEQANALLKEYEGKSEKIDAYICAPKFGEYLSAEERSKDWVSGEPRVDQSKLALNLLSERVRFGDTILKQKEIEELDYVIANVLWAEMQTLVYPNSARLPFLRSSSTTS